MFLAWNQQTVNSIVIDIIGTPLCFIPVLGWFVAPFMFFLQWLNNPDIFDVIFDDSRYIMTDYDEDEE